MVKDIDLGRILPHPENSNRMDAETLVKLRRHIERTGRYEPLVVRPHPNRPGCFQLINGHHRFQVLKAIGHASAKCIVWDVSDEQARLYLATLNRLSGQDIPEQRAFLVGSLLESFELDDLADLLPEGHDQLAELERLARIESKIPASAVPKNEENAHSVIIEFFLRPDDAKKVNLALDLIARQYSNSTARSDILVHLAQYYLDSLEPKCAHLESVGDT